MPLEGFKHAIPASKQPQTQALVHTTTGIVCIFLFYEYLIENRMVYLGVKINGDAEFSQGLDRLYLHFSFSYNFDFL